MTGFSPRAYDPHPCYEPVDGVVLSGWTTLAVRASRTRLLAVDGPEIAPWDELVSQLRSELGQRGVAVRTLDAREGMASWETIVASTSSTELADDPEFETLADASLEDLFQRPVQAESETDAVTVIFGPGAALSGHDELWYFDLPKRFAEAAVVAGSGRNLGQRDMPGNPTPGNPTARRLFYVDWPILDRHRETIAPRVSLWIDAQDADRPTALEAPTLAATAAALVRRPLRTRPVFNTTVWGGHWGQRQLGLGTDQPNSAVGYELIAPEKDVASRRAILARYLAGPNVTSTTGLDVHDVFDRSRGGDEWATQVLEDAFRTLRGELAPWFTRFQATTVAFGGAMTGSWDLVLPPIRSGLTTAGARIDIELLPSAETERSAVVGAATYAHPVKVCLSSADEQSRRGVGAEASSAIPATPTPKEPQAR